MAKIQKANKFNRASPNILGNVPKIKDYGQFLQLEGQKKKIAEVGQDDLKDGILYSYMIMP